MFAEIETLLNQRLGLDAASIGSSAIERAVRERVAACKLEDANAYWQYLVTSESELQNLIEAVIVPETWFYRDTEAFSALSRLATKEWLTTPARGARRLLSLPCSTGEEAYSMAMTLLDAGLPADRFLIEAVDVSVQALARAKKAVYGKNSFRRPDLDFRNRYFEATEKGHCLAEAVRQQVQFQPGNVMDGDLLPGAEIYDVIFCRNMLIYFDAATQERVVGVLRRLLKMDGVLFVGAAETALLAGHDLVSTREPLAFAFRKKDPATRPRKRVVVPTVAPRDSVPHPGVPRPTPAPVMTPTEIDIETAVRLADQGRLDEAARRCEEFLRTQGPSAKAFYLLGLVRDAAGKQGEADVFYRKALYLDPHHYDALIHLALLLDRQGDKAGAKVLYDRAERQERRQHA
jgi:chemotaxis protein methyltransferase WspC